MITSKFSKKIRKAKGKFKILGQIGLGLIVGLAMLYSNEVVIRVTPEVAQQNDLHVVKQVVGSDWKGNVKDMVYVKALLTNVPFMKGNELDYQKLVGGSTTFVWVFFVIWVIFIVTAVSNAANLTDGIDGLATGVSAIIESNVGYSRIRFWKHHVFRLFKYFVFAQYQ